MCEYPNLVKTGSCEKTGNTYKIHSYYEPNDPIFDSWRYMTGGIRVET
ncbi:MAG: hypothetical protein MAG795_01264 [Candidatus Woesearchaeota archaeon]|nr:hypothetical protein [Candidatus Woesearchaeota archaeon]